MVFESLGRSAYVLVLILADMYASGEALLPFPNSLLITCAGIQVGLYGFDYYGKWTIKEKRSVFGFVVGAVGYAVSFLGMLQLIYHTEYFWSTLLAYLLYVFCSVLYAAPPMHFNSKGGGSVFIFLTNGVIAVQLVTLSLNIGWSLQAVLLCVPSNLLLQASLVVQELAIPETPGITTTAGLLGKHGSFRFVVMMHAFAYFLVLVDFASISLYRGLPLPLTVWSLVLFYHLRQGNANALRKSSYRLFLTFTLLNAIGIMMESEHFSSDIHSKYNSFSLLSLR